MTFWKSCVYGTFTKNADGSYDVDGDFAIHANEAGGLKKLPVRFHEVTGSFDLSVCYDLITLEGSPEIVGKCFHWKSCTSLEELRYFPKRADLILLDTSKIYPKFNEWERTIVSDRKLFRKWLDEGQPDHEKFVHDSRGFVASKKFGF